METKTKTAEHSSDCFRRIPNLSGKIPSVITGFQPTPRAQPPPAAHPQWPIHPLIMLSDIWAWLWTWVMLYCCHVLKFFVAIMLLLLFETCQVIWLFLRSTVWHVFRFWNIVFIIFNRNRMFFDRIVSFPILPKYQRRSRFRQFRIVIVFGKKILKWKWWSLLPIVSYRFQP